jgi:hypothetical protein
MISYIPETELQTTYAILDISLEIQIFETGVNYAYNKPVS